MADSVPDWLWIIHPTAPDADYRIEAIVGSDEFDPECFEADVQVIRDELVHFSATFYTLAYLHSLFQTNAETGECGGGIFYRDRDAVFIRRFDRETIEAVVAALVAEGDIEWQRFLRDRIRRRVARLRRHR